MMLCWKLDRRRPAQEGIVMGGARLCAHCIAGACVSLRVLKPIPAMHSTDILLKVCGNGYIGYITEGGGGGGGGSDLHA